MPFHLDNILVASPPGGAALSSFSFSFVCLTKQGVTINASECELKTSSVIHSRHIVPSPVAGLLPYKPLLFGTIRNLGFVVNYELACLVNVYWCFIPSCLKIITSPRSLRKRFKLKLAPPEAMK